MLGRRATKPSITTTFPLDPFSFWTDTASTIVGLGGHQPAADPTAAFHTTYAPFPPGLLSFEVAFSGLRASRGTLTLSIIAIAADEADTRTERVEPVSLADLAAAGGRHQIRTIATEGWLYALVGRTLDETDAVADDLEVLCSQPRDTTLHERKLIDAQTTIFAPTADPTGLVVNQVATLAQPLSQMCTAAQFDEPDYARWLDIFKRPMHRHRKQWEYVFIGRTLEHMGVLKPLARGLGFGCGLEPLPAAFAAHNIFVTASDLAADDERAADWRATQQHMIGLHDLRDAAICPDHVFDVRVEFRAVDMRAIDNGLRDYDFCWSSCALEHLGSIDEGLRFIERSLDTLAPGGVAVHTTELNLTSNRRTLTKGGTVLFRRRDIEGLARRLLAAGHEVVPITFDAGDQPADRYVDLPPYHADMHLKLALGQFVSTSFGLVVRRGR